MAFQQLRLSSGLRSEKIKPLRTLPSDFRTVYVISLQFNEWEEIIMVVSFVIAVLLSVRGVTPQLMSVVSPIVVAVA